MLSCPDLLPIIAAQLYYWETTIMLYHLYGTQPTPSNPITAKIHADWMIFIEQGDVHMEW